MSDNDELQKHVQRTVGISALRKIRTLVDEYEAQDAADRRLARRVPVAIVALLVLAVIALEVFRPRVDLTRNYAEQIVAPQPNARRMDVGSGKIADGDLDRYVAAWGEKIDREVSSRIASAQRNYHGPCTVTVAIRSDGALERIQVDRSTGDKGLDKYLAGAIRQSAPFAPFPDVLKAKLDVLYVTRTFDVRS